MSWVDTATAITALRNLLLDGPTDKICSNKKVIGTVDNSNQIFKTFEYRRVTNFTTNAGNAFPLGVFKDGAQIAQNMILSDDIASGTFKLDPSVVPSGRSSITATYYYQWFLDSELDSYLQNASTWMGLGTNYINIPDGLNAAALDFAAREAYRAASMKYMIRAREVYQLEDAPDDSVGKQVDSFRSMAKDFMDSAAQLRKQYYARQDQAEAPLFNLATGNVSDPTPRR